MVMDIPVVNFEEYKLGVNDISTDKRQEICSSLKTALTDIGFVYLKNTGITQQQVDEVMGISKDFFNLPEDMKKPFSRGSFAINSNHGWVSLEKESLNPKRPGDLKEAFNSSSLDPDIVWPREGVPDFREKQVSFFLQCKELSLKILRLMGLSLDLNADVFLKDHKLIGTDKNGTTLRSLYYPPVTKVKEGQLRCGEHSDYGSITLVFQGPEGGLQVLSRSGEFVSAPYIPDTVLVNIADLMQRWTSDEFISVVHRVLLPPSGNSATRQSLAFFVQPDDEALITCCDGSNKYPPITAGAYLAEKFRASYEPKNRNIEG